MLELVELTKIYPGAKDPVVALDKVSLTVGRGEIFGVIGRSGAGKSTLIRCINLLERPTSGTVSVDGHDLSSLGDQALNRARREIGMVFQHFNLLSSRTAFDNVALPLEIAGTRPAEIRPRVAELLELVGLSGEAGRYPAQLSGGQKQRVGIARALANRPKVLLCDEATSALDPETTIQILDLVADINRRLGVTVVLITHEMSVVRRIADRVAVLEAGRVLESGPVYDIFTRPAFETTRRFVAETVGYEVPAALLAMVAENPGIGAATLMRVSLVGVPPGEPLMSRLVRNFAIDVRIVAGRIDAIQGRPFGSLVVLTTGTPHDIAAALDYMRQRNVQIEVLGHVAANDRAAS
ncbi:methionine ABC transporter ATP-binding protein [Vineibacter terrae]|uniref:Cell division ATP-binding protein FtsE n=1 Tax=Vineibacter terrae TaxID=2586908 RepID=A0A5C8PE37_9HYPH|nr:methionine ABC transporter ATP-binding protein [Vineibacter terrae]TXL72031.1 methionine ABC transporter ATP-binding protein [Vineibacter terrae]